MYRAEWKSYDGTTVRLWWPTLGLLRAWLLMWLMSPGTSFLIAWLMVTAWRIAWHYTRRLRDSFT